jgi:septal ring factor EnvC (AmiA/AmiB activator)
VKEDLEISEGLVARHEETIADVNEQLAKQDEACKEACNALRVVEIHMDELKDDLHEQKRMLGDETKARAAWQQRATDLANTSKALEQTIATNRLWEQRSKALYEMLLEEIKSAHGGNDEALAEITASLHDTFGQHIEKHKAAE